MNYPDDFNVPTFAAGKSIATSRAMGIGIMSAFLAIIFLCGILVWTIRSVHVEPYILSTGGINDQWQIIAPGSGRPEIKVTAHQMVQQSLIWNFVQDWFTISSNSETNTANWDDSCKRTDCDTTDTTNPCKLFCTASEVLFRRFHNDVLPTYEKMITNHEYLTPVPESIRITPIGNVIDAGGTWRIQMDISTNNQAIGIIAYAKVARNIKSYPKTMGYYIADFNSYRIK